MKSKWGKSLVCKEKTKKKKYIECVEYQVISKQKEREYQRVYEWRIQEGLWVWMCILYFMKTCDNQDNNDHI